MPSVSSITVISCLILSAFAQGSSKIGYSGTLSSLSGGLQGDVTVVDATTLMISNYELQDASAPALYFWGTTDGVLKDGFRISNMHITQATMRPTDITVKLDTGKTTADFTTVGLWCEQFGIDFGQATLQENGNANSTTTSTTTVTSGTPASASPSTGTAFGRQVPTFIGALAVLTSCLFHAHM